MTAHLKARPFWERTIEAVFAAPELGSLDPSEARAYARSSSTTRST